MANQKYVLIEVLNYSAKNNLQQHLKEELKWLKSLLTDTPNEIEERVDIIVKRANLAHPRCKTIEFRYREPSDKSGRIGCDDFMVYSIVPVSQEMLREDISTKAKQWDLLDEAVGKCYFDENGKELSDEDSENIDLCTIGEIAANHLGYL